jgi:peptidylprolyl isomerase
MIERMMNKDNRCSKERRRLACNERRRREECAYVFRTSRSLQASRLRSFGLVGHWFFDDRCAKLRPAINISRAGEIMSDQVKQGDTVRVHYEGRLTNGNVFDSSDGGDPLEFLVGSGQVIAGFDQGVRGMTVGDKKTIEIEADDAYGQRNDALKNTVPRDSINLDVEPQPGSNLVLQLPDGNEIPIAITEVTDDSITLDANHPLAGENLIFDIEVVGIDNAS